MPIRWIPNGRVSMQRPGMLLAVTAAASETRKQDLEALSRRSSRLLTTRHAILPDSRPHVEKYLSSMRLWARYGQESDQTSGGLRDAEVEIQDLWLADPALPSASGAITERVTTEPVLWALALKLLRSGNYTLTDRGRAVRQASSVSTASLLESRPSPNPFSIAPGAGLLLLFGLLDADLDFVRHAYRGFLELDGRFTRASASPQMAGVCRSLREEFRRKVRTGADRQTLQRLAELADNIEKAPDAKTWGGARPPEQTSTVRLEPYVDLGLLSRPSRYEYAYEFNEKQRQFFTQLTESEIGSDWLRSSLVGSYTQVVGVGTSVVEPIQAFEDIKAAWQSLRSSMGYASIDEALLLANARLIHRDAGHFELETGRQFLLALQREQPKLVRFTMARGGAVNYFRFSEALQVHSGE